MRALRTHLALSLSLLTLTGCGPLIEGLQNAERRVITLEPVKVGTRTTIDWANFGVCHSRLERRVVGTWALSVFRNYEPPYDTIAGHEVRVARGESCHLRETHRFQAAVQFDLSTLPAGAITGARLDASTLMHGGTDPPIEFGSQEQCRTLALGRATADWEAGLDIGGLLPSAGVRPVSRDFSSQRSFDVTRTVMEWKDGRTSNFGFVFTPDADAVARNAATVGDVGDQYMCPVMYRNFRLEVTMLVPRTRP